MQHEYNWRTPAQIGRNVDRVTARISIDGDRSRFIRGRVCRLEGTRAWQGLETDNQRKEQNDGLGVNAHHCLHILSCIVSRLTRKTSSDICHNLIVRPHLIVQKQTPSHGVGGSDYYSSECSQTVQRATGFETNLATLDAPRHPALLRKLWSTSIKRYLSTQSG